MRRAYPGVIRGSRRLPVKEHGILTVAPKKNYILILASMKLKPKITIADHFLGIEDPRIDRTKRHKLIDIMTIAVCAVICGVDGWVGIETYGCAKYEWLKIKNIFRTTKWYSVARYICTSICTNKSPTIPVMFSRLNEINTEDNVR